ncbi:MAG: CPBP family intramembrane metalloprotease [Thermoleophilaceae bacterium]|nr:CPBP family intramembrane metalloprotease [Thermoleophilaceae bacterium]
MHGPSLPPPPTTARPHPAPPWPPELPEGANPLPKWPAWYGIVAFLVAFIGISVIVGILIAATGTDAEDPTPAATIIGTVLQDAMLVGTAFLFASFIAKPRPWHFGLRRTRLWPAVGWALLGLVSYYVFAGVYSAIVSPEGEQTVAQDLGVKDGIGFELAAAFVIIWLAPITEEIFFRGFFYRALRNRFAVWSAALIDGIVFGAIHFTGSDTLEILPILAVLGIVFCLVYEKTGSIYPVIALHCFNNTLAFMVAADGSPVIAAAFGVSLIVGCFFAPRFIGRGAPPLPRVISRS